MARSTKMVFISYGIGITLLLGSVFFQNNLSNQTKQLTNLYGGVGICFNRISQSFTALMIGDVNSQYLTQGFKNLTQGCMDEVNREVNRIGETAFSDGTRKSLNEMSLKTQRFLDRVEKSKALLENPNEETNLFESNIPQRYAEIEMVKASFMDGVDERLMDVKGMMEQVNYANYFFIFSIFAVSAVLVTRRRKNYRESMEFEKYANLLLENNETQGYKVDRLMENVLKHYGHHNVWNLFKEYHEEIMENQAIGIDVDNPENNLSVPEKALSDFNEVFFTSLEGVQQEAFSSGVIVDFNFDQNLIIESADKDLEEIFNNIFEIGINKLKNNEEGDKKLTLRSKALGGTCYFKTVISNHLFNSEELNFINSADLESTEVSSELVTLKNTINRLGFTLVTKNRIHEDEDSWAEIEIGLIRSQEQIETPATAEANGPQLVSVVKGKKEDILKSFQSEI